MLHLIASPPILENFALKKERAVLINRIKDANIFIEAYTHELNSIRNSLAIYLQIKNQEDDDIPIIQDAELRLKAIIRNIQELNSGVTNFEATEIKIKEWLELYLNTFKRSANTNNRNLVIVINPMPITAFIYPSKLELIISNLIANAVKFSKKDSEITFRASHSNGRLNIEISDFGVEIPKSDLKNIFKKYYKVNRASSGLGLGLSICQKIVNTLGGKISVSSMDRETTFKVNIPAPSVSGLT